MHDYFFKKPFIKGINLNSFKQKEPSTEIETLINKLQAVNKSEFGKMPDGTPMER